MRGTIRIANLYEYYYTDRMTAELQYAKRHATEAVSSKESNI